MGRIKTGRRDEIVAQAKMYVDMNYHEKIGLDDVADFLGLNKHYFCSLFKEAEGIGFCQYVKQYRIEKSRTLFADTEKSIMEVMELTGFEDQSYFSKVFREIVGCTPGEYREKCQQSPCIA